MRRTESSFSVSIIPHTLSETILGFAHIGTEVNLETDIAGRYIRHFMNLGSEPTEEKPKKSMQSLLVAVSYTHLDVYKRQLYWDL